MPGIEILGVRRVKKKKVKKKKRGPVLLNVEPIEPEGSTSVLLNVEAVPGAAKRNRMRKKLNKMLKRGKLKLVVTAAPEVSTEHILAAANGAKKAVGALGLELALTMDTDAGRAWRLQGLESTSYKPKRKQVEGMQLRALIQRDEGEPMDHIRIHLTSTDMFDSGYSFVFASAGGRVILLSTHHLSKLGKKQGRDVLEYLVAHELGHQLGVLDRKEPNLVDECGTHCSSGGCVMRQPDSLRKLLRHLKTKLGSVFCEHCKKAAEKWRSGL